MKNTSEVWKKKSLIWHFAISDLKIRYRNSVLGFIWTFLEPLLLLSVMYIVFTNILKSQIEYFPLYLLLGLIMWNMLVRGTQLALSSIISRRGILTQINVPLEIPPVSAGFTSLVMLSLEMIVFGIFMAAFQFFPPLTIVILPLVLILEFVLIIGLALPLSVLNVRFRDTQFIWNIILQAGFFLTPVFYKSDIVPKQLAPIIQLNPMVHILNMAHNAVLYNTLPTGYEISMAVGITLAIFAIGYTIFSKLRSRIIEEL